MRFAFIGMFGPWNTESEIADYLEFAGHEVDRYQYDALNIDIFRTRVRIYDALITTVPQGFPIEFWRSLKIKKIAWYFDWIADYGNRENEYLPKLREFDLILSTDGLENKIYEGLPRSWFPHAVDTRVYHPTTGTPEYDVCFIGHVYTKSRRQLLGEIEKQFTLLKVGQGNECWGPGYGRACSRGKIIVGDNFRNDVPGYWSNRVYMTLACGAFYLAPRVPGMEEYFVDKKHLVYYDSGQDCVEKLRYYLEHKKERTKIAAAGAEHVAKHHNMNTRVKEFEQLCESDLSLTQTSRQVLEYSGGSCCAH